VAAFQENSGVAEGLSLLSTLEETRALNKYLGNLSITRVFHEKWCTKKLSVFSLWFHYFCREFAVSMAPGGALRSLAPHNSRYCYLPYCDQTFQQTM